MKKIDPAQDLTRYALVGRNDGCLEPFIKVLFEHNWRNVAESNVNRTAADLIIICDNKDEFVTHPASIPRFFIGNSTSVTRNNYDDVADLDAPVGVVVEQIDRWRPTPDAARFAEIARGFGQTAVRPIARGLSQQLQRAVENLDAGSFATAHRIAGIAGTLGFTRTSRAWLAIDEGDFSDVPAARREARLAIVAIERWLAATESAHESGG